MRGPTHSDEALAGGSPQSGTRSAVGGHRGRASLLIGALAAVALGLTGLSWPQAILAGWDASAIAFLVWVMVGVARKGPAETEAASMPEDDGVTDGGVVLGAGTASLIAVALILVEAGRAHGIHRATLIVFALASVLLAWCSIQTVYALRYARIYYTLGGVPIQFHEDESPDYVDFFYFALTIGMTFQVSDTNIGAKAIRRAAIKHALLSYVFGAFIVAIMVNVVAGLLGH